MEMVMTSSELIKPSSPTPPHLQHLKLSVLDQHTLFPPFQVQVLLFYSAQGDLRRFENTNMSARIKKSLSQVLTEFYPAAGEFNSDNMRIDCNDRGMEYVEERVRAPLTLTQLLSSNPHAGELRGLLPYGGPFGQDLSGALSAVQVTVFDGCGGMAIGVSISHLLVDGLSISMFVNRWAAIARGDPDSVSPVIGFGPLLFPSRDVKKSEYSSWKEWRPHPKLITKRFVFNQIKINALKASFTYQSPTTMEAMSAFIFRCLVKMSKSTPSKPIELIMAINLRAKMNPPLGAHHVGNFALPAKMAHNGLDSLNDMGLEIREFIRKYDSDYVKKLLADDFLLLMKIFEQEAGADARVFYISSLSKFPFYQADVGWGLPGWTVVCLMDCIDSVLLIDAKNGDGIEAWVTLLEDDMALFESGEELQEFICPSTNPMVCKL